MNDRPRHACRICDRTDLSLTANGRVRSHAANGKRPGPDNPACAGGSDWPRTVETHLLDDGAGGTWEHPGSKAACPLPECSPVTASGGPNPHRAPLPTGRLPQVHEEGCLLGAHSGSCGLTSVKTREAIEYLNSRTPEQKTAMALSMDRTASAVLGLPLDPGLPHDRNTDDTTEEQDPWPSTTPRLDGPRSTPPQSATDRFPGPGSGTTSPVTVSSTPPPIRSNQQTAAPQDPGSMPALTGTATDAENPSMKEISSVPTATAGTRDGTAAVTTDVFESASPVTQPEPKRDGFGRYLLPHPETGKRQAWTRATTMAKSISDTFALSQWSQRMVLKGASLRTDLVSLAGTLDVKQDKDKLNHLVDQAKDAAGQKISANLGTALHAHTENVDGGAALESVPENHRLDVAAYLTAMREAGLVAVPHLIERITVVPEFSVAGTFDRVLRTADGDYVIGDLKSGRTLEYGWQEIAIQLALYAHGVNSSGVYDMGAGIWEPDPLSRFDSAGLKVRTDYGIVMHLPVGESMCTLYRVDLEQGWAAATLCASVRDWRKTRNLAQPYVVAELDNDPSLSSDWSTPYGGHNPVAVSVRPPTWAERFAAVSSRGEAALLYMEAVNALGRGPELDGLADIGMRTLAALEEPAG